MFGQRTAFVVTGFAIFAMFFGAGNVVFPLQIGQFSGGSVSYAVLGLMLTGIILPLTGLYSMFLFEGDYYAFFDRVGKWPGLFAILLIMALIGPFAGIPRTITLAYSTMTLTWVDIPMWLFNGIFCGLVFVIAYRRDAILAILGKFLTPALLFFLACVIVRGLWLAPQSAIEVDATAFEMFIEGFTTGYNTMDMLAAMFFSTVVLAGLHAKLAAQSTTLEHKHLFQHLIRACFVAGGLLFLVYGGFCFVAARHADMLQGVAADELLGFISLSMLGDAAGLIANGVVSIACLTTAVTLVSVFSEFLSHFFFKDGDAAYKPFVILTTLAAFAMSFLGFVRIIHLIFPLIAACYPTLIVLAILNIAYKRFNITMVKIPVLITFVVTVVLLMR